MRTGGAFSLMALTSLLLSPPPGLAGSPWAERGQIHQVGGPPPWAPAHGYRPKHRHHKHGHGRHHHHDHFAEDDRYFGDDDHRVGYADQVPDLGVELGLEPFRRGSHQPAVKRRAHREHQRPLRPPGLRELRGPLHRPAVTRDHHLPGTVQIRGLDDSVARVVGGAAMVLRRPRGLAPARFRVAGVRPGILGVGGHLKATVALTVDDGIVLGPHIGDLESAAAREAMRGSR